MLCCLRFFNFCRLSLILYLFAPRSPRFPCEWFVLLVELSAPEDSCVEPSKLLWFLSSHFYALVERFRLVCGGFGGTNETPFFDLLNCLPFLLLGPARIRRSINLNMHQNKVKNWLTDNWHILFNHWFLCLVSQVVFNWVSTSHYMHAFNINRNSL